MFGRRGQAGGVKRKWSRHCGVWKRLSRFLCTTPKRQVPALPAPHHLNTPIIFWKRPFFLGSCFFSSFLGGSGGAIATGNFGAPAACRAARLACDSTVGP